MRRFSGPLDRNGRLPPVADAPAQDGAVPEFQMRTEGLADSTSVIAVPGEIDLFTGPQFSDAVHGGVNERLEHSTRPVFVVADHPNVLRVLRLTAVDQVLGLYPTRSAALSGNARA
jgi:hypothetical protein